MPQQKALSSEEMAQFVAECLARFQLADTQNVLKRPLPVKGTKAEALKASYQGWLAVQWIEQHGVQVSAEEITPWKAAKVRAGNSLEKRLWKARIIYLKPLGAYYQLPKKVWQWVLKAGAAGGHLPSVVAPTKGGQVKVQPSPYLITLANKPSVLIDRATRGVGGWNKATLQYHETFEDGLVLNYYEESAGQEQLRQQLMTLDPRTSDIWRLLTAKALENDRNDLFSPIKVKPGELAQALGLKLHPNGSVRPKDVLRCTQSLFHLERLWLTLPDAGPHEDGTRKRVLAVMERGKARKIEGQAVPSSWTIVLGDWARYFPRSYAPLFRGLVELPANSATNLWAKQIGTELTYLIRETAEISGLARQIHVQTLLIRASLMQDTLDLREHRNQNRAIERFETALDLLIRLGIYESWAYEGDGAANLDRVQGRPEFFETWLTTRIEFRVPERFLRDVAKLLEKTDT